VDPAQSSQTAGLMRALLAYALLEQYLCDYDRCLIDCSPRETVGENSSQPRWKP